MRFTAISVVALAGFAAAAPSSLHKKRDFEALKTDVATIGDDVLTVRDALTNFTQDQGYFAALVGAQSRGWILVVGADLPGMAQDIDGKAQTLLQALQTATSEAQNTQPLGPADSVSGLLPMLARPSC